MLGFIIRRLLLTIPIGIVVYTLIFLLIRVAPGDPAIAVLGDNASKEAIDALRISMGLDKPLLHQYAYSILNYFKGDFGISLLSGTPVIQQLKSAIPHTLELTFGGVLLGLIFGIPLGIITALHRNTFIDFFGRIISLVGLSIPSFFLGILLMFLFSIELSWFPAIGIGRDSEFFSRLYYLFLPTLTLGLIMMAYVTGVTRSSMLNTLKTDYIKTARSKGISEISVILNHAFRNAIVPIISITGINTIVLISSSVMVEIIFARPGLGKLLIGSMLQRDYIALQSVMVVYAIFVILINLITDLLYGIADPRIKKE
jgi:ABC-type dipeptide/oligopeptide/nickel transport system permease component